MSIRLLAAFAISSSLAGCAMGYVVRPGDIAPVTARLDPGGRTVAWQRAIAVLLDEGYVPQVLDANACYISAKHRDDVADDTLTGTIAIVIVSPDGVVRVEVGGAGIYHSAQDLQHDVQAVQARLIAKIMQASATPST